MDFILTFVASSSPLSLGFLRDALAMAGLRGEISWVEEGKAADILLEERPAPLHFEKLWPLLVADRVDIFSTRSDARRKSLLIADMDATIVTAETLDELAAHAGLQDRVASITARAMRGELDFRDALKERVGLLKGLRQQALDDTLARIDLSEGASVLVRTMAAHGASCVLVSGGFTFFTGPVAQKTGFHHHHGNILDMDGLQLAGTVSEPILDKNAKLDFLRRYRDGLKLKNDDVMAIGDGANDLPMLEEAGFGVGYRPKPAVREKIHNCILHGDLTAALYAQGYTSADFFTGH